jgi:glycosyltransferase involved in cell wall biosynthesis
VKILIIYRHYWPDTPPLGSMLRTLAEHMAARGHRVYVFTAQPSYQGRTGARQPKREFKGGVRVIRTPLLAETGGGFRRSVNAVVYLISAMSYAVRHRFDLVWTNTLPPVVNGMVGFACAKEAGARFLYHVQDVYPEAAVVSGLMRRGALAGMLARMDSWVCRAASAVVVLSDDMMRTIADRGGNGAVAFHVLNNFVLAELTTDEPPPGRLREEGFRLVFSGNLGRFQNLDVLIEAMALIRPEEGISLEFIGSGVAEERLAGMVKDRGLPHVRFNARLPAEEAFALTRTADMGVISLIPDMYRVSFPSKLMTYLAAGLPVLAVVEPDSALAHYLEDNDAGAAVQGDAAAVAAAIRGARDRFAGDDRVSARMTGLAERDFGREIACERWAQLIDRFAAD